MKLLDKERVSTRSGSSITGTRVRKRYDQARTPYQRVLESTDVGEEVKERLRMRYQGLNPRQLLRQVNELQNRLWSYARAAYSAKAALKEEVREEVKADVKEASGPELQARATNKSDKGKSGEEREGAGTEGRGKG